MAEDKVGVLEMSTNSILWLFVFLFFPDGLVNVHRESVVNRYYGHASGFLLFWDRHLEMETARFWQLFYVDSLIVLYGKHLTVLAKTDMKFYCWNWYLNGSDLYLEPRDPILLSTGTLVDVWLCVCVWQRERERGGGGGGGGLRIKVN